MKIALVGRFGEGDILSGPERVARELFSQLKSKNHQVIFIEYFFSGYTGRSLYKKIFGKEYSYNNLIIKLGIISLLLFLIKNKFDIIHIVNSQRFILFLLLLNPFFSCKIVTTLHGFTQFETPKKKYWLKRYFVDVWVEKLLVKKSMLLIFPSTLLLNTFRQFYKILDEKSFVIHNGISSEFFEQKTVSPSIENVIKLVFYNGFNNSINRGLDKLLDLMNNLKYEVELYVIGNKVEVKLQKNIKIIFSDPMSHVELINFISDKHFIIKSSAYDTFPIIVVECMALGLIPIISENVGIKDVIEHGKNGFIYDSSKEDDLAKLLNQISSRKFDLDMISANAKKIYEVLNWKNITEQYMAAYKSLS